MLSLLNRLCGYCLSQSNSSSPCLSQALSVSLDRYHREYGVRISSICKPATRCAVRPSQTSGSTGCIQRGGTQVTKRGQNQQAQHGPSCQSDKAHHVLTATSTRLETVGLSRLLCLILCLVPLFEWHGQGVAPLSSMRRSALQCVA